jgi:hypothetical protein
MKLKDIYTVKLINNTTIGGTNRDDEKNKKRLKPKSKSK